jgi:hypothetical protein
MEDWKKGISIFSFIFKVYAHNFETIVESDIESAYIIRWSHSRQPCGVLCKTQHGSKLTNMSSNQNSEELKLNGFGYPCDVRMLPSEEKNDDRQPSTWAPLWREFVSSTTLHGVRFIFYQDTYIFRRYFFFIYYKIHFISLIYNDRIKFLFGCNGLSIYCSFNIWMLFGLFTLITFLLYW